MTLAIRLSPSYTDVTMVGGAIRSSRSRGFLALLGAALLFGSTGAFVTILNQYFTEPGQLIIRSLVATLMVVALARLMRSKFHIHRSQIKHLVAIGALYALSTSCFVYAVTSVKASTALFMLYIGVIVLTQIMGAAFFKEGFGRRNITTLALVGVAFFLYMQPIGQGSVTIGLLIAFVGGAFEAASYAVRKGKNTITKESITAAQMIGGLVIGIMFLLLSGNGVSRELITPLAFAIMLLLGAIYVGIGHLITYGMRHYSLGVGSVVLSSDLLFALVINAVMLRQIPTTFEIIGCMVLFGAIIYATEIASASETIDDELDKDDDDEGTMPTIKGVPEFD